MKCLALVHEFPDHVAILIECRPSTFCIEIKPMLYVYFNLDGSIQAMNLCCHPSDARNRVSMLPRGGPGIVIDVVDDGWKAYGRR